MSVYRRVIIIRDCFILHGLEVYALKYVEILIHSKRAENTSYDLQ